MSAPVITPNDTARLRSLRHRSAIDHLDYLRGLADAAQTRSQRELAGELGLSQPSIASALATAAKLPAVPEGFCGAGPYEIAQRYAAGLIGRDQLVHELITWPYQPQADVPDSSDFYDADPAGTFEEVILAHRHHLIDAATYDQVLQQRAQATA